MGGTKGSHIVLDHPELLAATGGRELFFENKDGRIVLIYPLKGRVLVGTTDLEHDMRDPIVCTEAEVDYFIDLVRHVLPDITVDRDRDRLPVLGRPAAARPRRPRPGLRLARLPHRVGAAERRHRCDGAEPRRRQVDDLPGLGRAPRRPGARTCSRGRGDAPPRACRSAAGAATRPPSARGGSGSTRTARACPLDRVATLLDRYGTVAADVIAAIADDPDDAPLKTLPAYSTAELRHLARTEDVVHLDDVLMRRTSLAFTGEVTADVRARGRRGDRSGAGVGCRRLPRRDRPGLARVHAADPTLDAEASARSTASR